MGKRFSAFPTRSNTNRVAQPQKIARGLKFRIEKVGGLYYLCGQNKGAGELRSHCAADLGVIDFGVSDKVQHKQGNTATEDS